MGPEKKPKNEPKKEPGTRGRPPTYSKEQFEQFLCMAHQPGGVSAVEIVRATKVSNNQMIGMRKRAMREKLVHTTGVGRAVKYVA